MSQLNTIIVVSTAVVAGIIGAVSLYLVNNVHQHHNRTNDDENLRNQLVDAQNELKVLREQFNKSLKKRQKRRNKRDDSQSLSVFSEADFKSVASTEHDSSSEEYYDFSTDVGEDDDITLTEDDVPGQNGVTRSKKDPFDRSLEEIDNLLFSGSDADVQNAYEILITLYNSRDILSDGKYAEVLWRLCKYCQRMANVFKQNDDTDRRKDIINEGCKYGENAVTLNSDNYNTHKWYAILVGMRSELQGMSDKIKDGQLFYKHTSAALEINQSDGSLYHLRGRFIYEIANLSWFERKTAGALFGALPEVDFDDAIKDFKMADELHDVPWKENKLMLAQCYLGKGMVEEGINWLKDSKNIPNRISDDEVVSAKIEELLKKYNQI